MNTPCVSTTDPITESGPKHQQFSAQNKQPKLKWLKSDQVRKKYLKLKDQIFNLETKKGTTWLLQQCKTLNIIPKQFRNNCKQQELTKRYQVKLE